MGGRISPESWRTPVRVQGHGHKTNDKVKSLFPPKHKDAQAKGSVSTPSSKKGANKKSDGKVQSKLCFK